MRSEMIRCSLAFIVLSALWLQGPGDSWAQYSSNVDLPGQSDSEFATTLAIMGVAGVLGLVVASSRPHALRLEESDGLDLSTPSGSQAALQQLGGEGTFAKVKLKNKETVYGSLRTSADGDLELAMAEGMMSMDAGEVQSIENLDTLSTRQKAGRTGYSILFLGIGISFLYASSTSDSSFEGSQKSLQTAVGLAFMGLAAYSIIQPSGDERALAGLQSPEPKISVAAGLNAVDLGPQVNVCVRF